MKFRKIFVYLDDFSTFVYETVFACSRADGLTFFVGHVVFETKLDSGVFFDSDGYGYGVSESGAVLVFATHGDNGGDNAFGFKLRVIPADLP